MLDYARVAANAEFARLLEARIRAYYQNDRDCPLPSNLR